MLVRFELVAVHKSLHFLKRNGAIVVSIHCLEDALLGRLPPGTTMQQ
jgi:hypothetical protein